MRKLVKILLGIIGIFIILAILTAISLVIFVNPNHFKPRISQQVYKMTGRTLTFTGDLHWTFFPAIGIKLGTTQLSNSANFNSQPFISLDKAIVAVDLLPLLEGRIQVNELLVENLTLNLITNKNGQNNWQGLIQSSKSPKLSSTTNIGNSDSTTSSWVFFVPKLNIKNATINWVNQQANQTIKISQLNLLAQQINLNQPFPVDLSFIVNSSQPFVNGNFSLKSTVSVNLNQNLYQFNNSQLQAQLQPDSPTSKSINLLLTGNIIVSRDNLQVNLLTLSVNDTNITGTLQVKNFNNPMINFNLQADKIYLDPYLALLSSTSNSSSNQTFNNSSSSNAAPTFSSPNASNNLSLQGQIKVGQLTVKKLQLQNINASLNLKNNILTVAPLTANLYGGSYNGNIIYDMHTAIPKFNTQSNLENLRIEDLLSSLADSRALSGLGNMQVNLNSQGNDRNTILSNLNGNVKINISQGQLTGIDFFYLVTSAVDILSTNVTTIASNLNPLTLLNNTTNLLKSSTQPSNRTDFSTLSATGSIQKGILTNNDLLLLSPKFQISGNGTINFVNEQFNYLLQGTLVKNGKVSAQNVPIKISGTLSKPHVQLELDKILKSTLKSQLSPVEQLKSLTPDLKNLPSTLKSLPFLPGS